MGPASWLFATLLLVGTPARAAEPQGRVLRIDGVDLYAAVGLGDGVRDDAEVLVYRSVSVPAPGGGPPLRDLFFLGNARVVEAGESLSRIRARPELARQIKVGDVVSLEVIVRELPATPPPAAAPPAPTPVPVASAAAVTAPIPADQQAFRSTFDRAAGAPTNERIDLWLRFLDAYPSSELVDAVHRELQALAESPPPDAPAPPPVVPPEPPPTAEAPAAPEPLELVATALASTAPGQAVRVVLTAPGMEQVDEAWLFYRRAEETVHRHVAMAPYGDTAMVGTLPADAVQAPGVDWYVAVQDVDGHEHRVGTQQVPWSLAVVTPQQARTAPVSELSLSWSYDDFYYLQGIDRFHVGQVDYLHRLFGTLYSVRMGFGRYVGVGGDTEAIDAAQGQGLEDELVRTGFEYGYTAVELDSGEGVALVARGMVGVMPDGLGFGIDGMLRIGHEQGANLLVGAGHVTDIGTSYQLCMRWTTVPRVPMRASVAVTDEPGGDPGSWGVRFAFSPRFELTRWLALEATAGYQLRNIHHQGPVFGGQGVIRW